jgi:hypothetical protein
MFRHRSAIFRESNETKRPKYVDWLVGLVLLCFTRLPEDGTEVTKHVGFILTITCV